MPRHFPRMKALPLAATLGFLATLPLAAQVGIPATPKKFDTNRIGDAASGGSAVNATPQRPQTVLKTTTHIVLGEPRQWKMADGKSYIGKLIAFEDIVITGNAPAPLTVPKNPTVVREGKARLLVEAKAYEVPLQNFGDEEKKFIEEVRVAVAAKK
jgi:hypothetical protein